MVFDVLQSFALFVVNVFCFEWLRCLVHERKLGLGSSLWGLDSQWLISGGSPGARVGPLYQDTQRCHAFWERFYVAKNLHKAYLRVSW